MPPGAGSDLGVGNPDRAVDLVSFPELTSREHEIAAQECDAVADYLEKRAMNHDGPYAEQLARQHHADAIAVRARADRHRGRVGA